MLQREYVAIEGAKGSKAGG